MRSIIIIAFFFGATSLYAQQYGVFRLGLSSGNAKPNHYSLDASVGHKFALGLKLETYFQNTSEKSYSITTFGNYYFSLPIENLRPFVSIGAGNYHISPETSRSKLIAPSGIVMYQYSSANGDTKGIFFRAGLDYRHFSIAAEYNLIYRRETTIVYTDANFFILPDLTKQIYLSDNYFTLKLGVYLGGGLKKKE